MAKGIAIAVSIPEHLFVSPAYRSLAPLERCLLTELLALVSRVGSDEPLRISVQMAGKMCGVSRSHATRAMSELEARGFIVNVRRGEKRQRSGFSSTWRVTCLPFRGEWATCDYNHIYDREHNRKVAGDREGDKKFLTPELEALWVKTEASFASRSHSNDDAEVNELLARMDAERAPVLTKRRV
jgi:DNA-binding transcriptional MocR family regulator